MNSAPTLETARLVLRAHTREAFEESFQLWSDPDVVRYTTGKPSTREEAWGRLLRNAGHWALLGFGYWMVWERASGAFVGEVGLANLQRELEPSLAGSPEAGWVLAPKAWGRGFATEAVRAVLDWEAAQLRSPRTVCIVHPDNFASVKVAEKCGFQEIARTVYHGSPTIVFERRAVTR